MTFDIDAIFKAELNKAVADEVAESGFPVERWLYSGRTKPEEALAQWYVTGPEHVRQFIRWFEGSGHQVAIMPDGRPAIELDLTARFGDVEVHGFIDLITTSDTGLTVIDLKSGSRKPDNMQQLGIYAGMIELTYGPEWRPRWGAHFRTRGQGPKGAKPEDLVYFQPPVRLDEHRYSVEFFTRELAMFDQAVNEGLFVAKPGPDCRSCPVSYACVAVGGYKSHLYDPSDPDYIVRSIHPSE